MTFSTKVINTLILAHSAVVRDFKWIWDVLDNMAGVNVEKRELITHETIFHTIIQINSK